MINKNKKLFAIYHTIIERQTKKYNNKFNKHKKDVKAEKKKPEDKVFQRTK